MKIAELIEKLKLLPPELDVVTEGDESLSLNDPNPRIEYYLSYGKGPDTPTYSRPVERFFNHETALWEMKKLTPVVIL